MIAPLKAVYYECRHFRHIYFVKYFLQELFSNIDQGQDKLQATIGKGEIVLPETSNQGQDLIKEELSMLTTEFEGFVADGDDLKNNLGKFLIT